MEMITIPPVYQLCDLTALLDVADVHIVSTGLVWEDHNPWAKEDMLLNVQCCQRNHIGP